MGLYTKEQIAASKRLYGNPYAHIEYCEDPDNISASKNAEADAQSVHASRKLLENQYSYLDGDGDFSGLEKSPNIQLRTRRTVSKSVVNTQQTPAPRSAKQIKEPKKYSEKQIEQIAKGVQIKLWKEKSRLWDGAVPNDPIQVLDPSHALSLGGYSLGYVGGFGPELKDGILIDTGGLIGIAGLLDQSNKIVKISQQFTPEEQLFTAAHELGHTLLHGKSVGLRHRDRPSDGTKRLRDQIEREADKFAAYFLMPEKLVRNHFLSRFQADRFVVTDEAAFNLGFLSTDALRKKVRNKDGLARLLASTGHYQSNFFKSLASQFRVSIGAMAIRLGELDLIEFNKGGGDK